MWDNAPLLRGIANALFAISLLMVLYGAIYYAAHLPGLFPLHSVRLDAAPQRIEADAVLRVVQNEVHGNFFTVDIERVRQSLEKLPWVRSVSIRREFPSRLAVRLEEHQVLAHWNNKALVNRQGEIFMAKVEQALPSFTGQDEASAEVMQHYTEFNGQLATLNLQVAEIVLSPRHAWQLRLSNGMVLELGHEDMQQRLAKFVEAYPDNLASVQGRVKYVDLRYRNGFAVSGLANSGLAKQS